MSDPIDAPEIVNWTYVDVWEGNCAALRDETVVIQGDYRLTWDQFNRAANRMAQQFLDAGLSKASKVATYMMNCPEYLVACAAALKVGMPPFNVNFRYGPDELWYLFDNADAEAIVFQTQFADKLDGLRGLLPLAKIWIAIPSEGFPVPDWAVDYRDLLAGVTGEEVRAPWGRSGEDALMIYTGGTTGMPKGVLWAQNDLVAWKYRKGFGIERDTYAVRPEDVGEMLKHEPQQRWLIAPPLMHATGLFHAFDALTFGGVVVLSDPPKFNAEQVWDEVARNRITHLSVVGEPFCLPLLEALKANPGRWNLSTLAQIASSGAMWRTETKSQLLTFLPQCTLVDSYASSEAFGMGRSEMTVDKIMQTGTFKTSASCQVFTEDGRAVQPGSDEVGMVAVSTAVPLGYYKDREKSEKAFPTINGRRWALPGDFAKVAADGSLILLGRGSQCINTGGEKVFPEEVEECLKTHPAVRDAAVLGMSDPRFGERVTAVVELRSEVGDSELISHVRERLADYKAPRAVYRTDSLTRSPNGKLDYKLLRNRLIAGA
jgi:acyl-CoA synthetase (AMP-forming)/AMP-acid ligase II